MSTNPPNVISRLRAASADRPHRPAVEAPGLLPTTYAELWRQVDGVAANLSALGVGLGDAVATALPDGPEVIAAALGAMVTAAWAPLNHRLRGPELEALIGRLRPRCLLVRRGAEGDATVAAAALSIPVLVLEPGTSEPSALTSQPAARGRAPNRYSPETAALLFTSATTGRPKLVPLAHQQLIAMVDVMRATFPDSDNGRALMMTPHFHLQFVLSALLQLASGGRVITTAGFDPGSFIGWMREYSPTHYTASPTLHRAILDLVRSENAYSVRDSLRYLSSAGAPLTDTLRSELETEFRVSVIEGYGLTETGRITKTPTDPARRKPGSAGEIVGVEVAIVDEDGTPLPCGSVGEILVRGDTVITAYADDPEADAVAFRDGWFRTGDLGRVDEDGLLFIAGRIKEAINRGGEKILPNEVEEVLGRHEAVADIAVFGCPHPRLGEDVAAAIVLRSPVSAAELRCFAAASLADYKIPRLMEFVESIPRTPTGKARRTDLARALAERGDRAVPRTQDDQPLDDDERQIALTWESLLGVASIQRDEDFFLLGGDSLLAMDMVARIESELGVQLSPAALVASATVGSLADEVRRCRARGGVGAASCMVTFRRHGDREPLYLVHPLEGDVLKYRHLVRRLGSDRPLFGFEALGRRPGETPDTTIEEMACRYIEAMRAQRPSGPYWLAGYSLGGLIAHEMARQLHIAGADIGGLVLIDTWCARPSTMHRLGFHAGKLRGLSWLQRLDYCRDKAARLSARCLGHAPDRESTAPSYEAVVRDAVNSHPTRPVPVRALLLWCHRDPTCPPRDVMRREWHRLVIGGLEILDMPGTHDSIMVEPQVLRLAQAVERFATTDRQSPTT